MINQNFLDSRMQEFVRRLAKDREERGYRPDLRVLSSQLDERNGRVWITIAFSTNLPPPSTTDVMKLVYSVYPDFVIDWKSSFGYKNGTIHLALKPFIEKITIKTVHDIPSGFKSRGTGLYEFKEADGKISFWRLIKNGNEIYLVRVDGTEPPKVVPFIESEKFKAGMLVKLPDNRLGVIKGFNRDKYCVQILGQTEVIETTDVAVFDPTTDREILRQYYSNLFPPEFVEGLLKGYLE